MPITADTVTIAQFAEPEANVDLVTEITVNASAEVVLRTPVGQNDNAMGQAAFARWMVASGELNYADRLTGTPTSVNYTIDNGVGTAVINAVDVTNAGLMIPSDKLRLDGMETGANAYVHPPHSGDVVSVGDGATTIQPNRITTAMLQDSAVSTGKIANNAITSDKLGAQSVINAAMADNAVQGDVLADGTVIASKINANAVTTTKIQNDAVTADKLADNSVFTLAIQNNAVLTGKIADSQVTLAKLASDALTNLSNTPAASTLDVESSTGGDTTLPAATTTDAGVMTAADKIKVDTINVIVSTVPSPGAAKGFYLVTEGVDRGFYVSNGVEVVMVAPFTVDGSS